MKRRWIISFALVTGFILSPVAHAKPTPQVQAEINHLLDYVAKSGCAFYRNGTWYDSETAQQHLSKKYDYMESMNLINTADEFIEKIATESSLSNERYQVKCTGEVTTQSNIWLHDELVRYQKKSDVN